MRVLLTSREFPGLTPLGGIGTYTRILGGALAEAGVDAHVLCVRAGLPRDSFADDGLTVHTGPQVQPRGIGRLTRAPATLGRLSQALSVAREYRRLGERFDVVEAPELNAEGLLVGLLRLAPLVVRLHSSVAQLIRYSGADPGRDGKCAAWLERAGVRRADIVVSTAPNLRSEVPGLGLDERHVRAIIYPVVTRPPAAPPSGPPVVLFAGRLEPRKNPDVLIRALPAVRSAFPAVRLRLVGADGPGGVEGSYGAGLRRLAQECGVEDAVEFADELPHEELLGEMAAAAVCAFPSLWESFGLVVAEAASIGRPVVVSAIPAFLDYVVDGVSASVAPVDDPGAWAAAIVGVLEDPDAARRRATRLRDEIARRANPSAVARLAIEAYEAAIERRRRAG